MMKGFGGGGSHRNSKFGISWRFCNDLPLITIFNVHIAHFLLSLYSQKLKNFISDSSIDKIYQEQKELEMWANAQHDGRPAEYSWRPLFNAAVWMTTHYSRVPYSDAAKTRNPLKLAGVPQTTGSISAASRPKFTVL